MADTYIVRHGQSSWNAERRWAGHADPPLSDLGRLQAKEACPRLKEMGFKSISSSDLSRAKETATIIAGELGLELTPPVPALKERQSGEICGLTSQDIDIRFPGLLNRWRAGEIIEIPGGEVWSSFVERVFQGLYQLSSWPSPVLVVSHEGVLRAVEFLMGEKQVRHENLEGRWLRILNQSLQPIV